MIAWRKAAIAEKREQPLQFGTGSWPVDWRERGMLNQDGLVAPTDRSCGAC